MPCTLLFFRCLCFSVMRAVRSHLSAVRSVAFYQAEAKSKAEAALTSDRLVNMHAGIDEVHLLQDALDNASDSDHDPIPEHAATVHAAPAAPVSTTLEPNSDLDAGALSADVALEPAAADTDNGLEAYAKGTGEEERQHAQQAQQRRPLKHARADPSSSGGGIKTEASKKATTSAAAAAGASVRKGRSCNSATENSNKPVLTAKKTNQTAKKTRSGSVAQAADATGSHPCDRGSDGGAVGGADEENSGPTCMRPKHDEVLEGALTDAMQEGHAYVEADQDTGMRLEANGGEECSAGDARTENAAKNSKFLNGRDTTLKDSERSAAAAVVENKKSGRQKPGGGGIKGAKLKGGVQNGFGCEKRASGRLVRMNSNALSGSVSSQGGGGGDRSFRSVEKDTSELVKPEPDADASHACEKAPNETEEAVPNACKKNKNVVVKNERNGAKECKDTGAAVLQGEGCSSGLRAKGSRKSVAVGALPSDEDLVAIAKAQKELEDEEAAHACDGRAVRTSRQSGRQIDSKSNGRSVGVAADGKVASNGGGGVRGVAKKPGKRGVEDVNNVVVGGRQTRSRPPPRKSARNLQ